MPAFSPSLCASADDPWTWDRVQDQELVELIRRAPMPGLGSDPKCAQTSRRIEAWEASGQRPPLVLAGLWLLAGDLERSHSISQDHHSADGSMWHGVMHRREGDFGNAKYWFRQAGNHPVYTQLRQRLAAGPPTDASGPAILAQLRNRNLPESLVDCVAAAAGDAVPVLTEVCWLEWQLMLLHQVQRADR
jgi:hypothetical protein